MGTRTRRVLRIVVLSPEYPGEGDGLAGRFVHEQVVALSDLGHQVTVVVPTPRIPPGVARLDPDWARKRSLPPRYRLDGVEVYAPRVWMIPAYRGFQFAGWLCERAAGPTVRHIHSSQGVDLVHAHMLIVAEGALRIGRGLGVPVVWTVHGQEDPRAVENTASNRRALQGIASGMDRVVVVGEPLRRYVRRLGTDGARIRVVPNGVELPIAGPVEQGLAGAERHPRVLLSVSGLRPEKGLDDNLRALRLLLDRGYDVRYRVVGDGSERKALVRLARQLGVTNQVAFEGAVDRQGLPTLLAACDVFTVPSWLESFGLAHAEAMLAGKPVVACRATGPEAFVEDGVSGVLVAPRDPRDLAARLAWLLDHPEAAGAMGARGRDRIRSDFTWERSARSLEEVYAEVADARAVGRRAGRSVSPADGNGMTDRGANAVLVSNVSHYARTAEALHRAGHLNVMVTGPLFPRVPAILSSLPAARRALERRSFPGLEGVPLRRTWLPELVWRSLTRFDLLDESRRYRVGNRLYDLVARRHLQECEVFHTLNGITSTSLHRAKERGAFVICDQRSTHPMHEQRVVGAESAALGIPYHHPEEAFMQDVLDGYRLADLIVCPSEYVAGTFREEGVDPSKLRVVPLGCDPLSDPVGEASRPGDPFTVLFVGSVIPRKGVRYLVQAMRLIPDRGVRLLLVGSLPKGMHAQLEGADHRLQHVPHLSGGDLARVYGRASVLVLPSLADAWGLVVLEAMAAGVPVVVTTEVGAAQAVRHGVDGFVVPPRDPGALADAIRGLIDDHALRAAMGQEARARCREFSWEAYGERIVALYDSLPLDRAARQGGQLRRLPSGDPACVA